MVRGPASRAASNWSSRLRRWERKRWQEPLAVVKGSCHLLLRHLLCRAVFLAGDNCPLGPNEIHVVGQLPDQPNPTVETLCRYAAALGKRLVWQLADQPLPQRGGIATERLDGGVGLVWQLADDVNFVGPQRAIISGKKNGAAKKVAEKKVARTLNHR